MNSIIQILLALATAATSSFLQTPPSQLDSTYNSTVLNTNERLFQPIIIPNITKYSETSEESRPNENSKESTEEGLKLTGNSNSPKFSSRYSTKVDTTEYPNEEVISKRLDDLEEDNNEYSEETEEVEPTTESQTYGKYPDEEEENNETTTTEETDSSEEKLAEDKRSVEDYYNSGSKNYHSIQTPLNRIKYQGLNSYRDDWRRIVSPITRRPLTPNWPYSKSQLKTELDKNEISEDEEVKLSPKQLELESAEEKDRNKHLRNKKYDYVQLRNERKQQQKALIAEEEKDDQKPLFQSLKQYLVDEKEQGYQPVFNFENKISIPKRNIRIYTISKQAPNFKSHRYLGPIVFNENNKPQKNNILLKGLIDNEKLDQENLNNQRFEKLAPRSGSKSSQSFDHIKESDDMYNAILANIQSVFGLKSQQLKRNQKGSAISDVDLDESKALTWTVPSKKYNRKI